MNDTLSLETGDDMIETVAEQTVTALPEYPFVACDGHELPNIQALFEIMIPSADPRFNTIVLCGNCSNKFGFGHSSHGSWMANEKKLQGSHN